MWLRLSAVKMHEGQWGQPPLHAVDAPSAVRTMFDWMTHWFLISDMDGVGDA
jgi:hypothetical protein